jgi:hypothetical protein
MIDGAAHRRIIRMNMQRFTASKAAKYLLIALGLAIFAVAVWYIWIHRPQQIRRITLLPESANPQAINSASPLSIYFPAMLNTQYDYRVPLDIKKDTIVSDAPAVLRIGGLSERLCKT